MTTRRYRIPTCLHVLTALLDRGEQTLRQVSEQCLVDKAMTHTALVTLEKAGCVERKRDKVPHLWRVGKRIRDAKQ